MPNPDEIGYRIKQLRLEHHMTTSELAAEVKRSEAAVRSWETGKASPDIATVVLMARLFGVTTDYLVGVTEARSYSATERLDGEIAALEASIAGEEHYMSRLRSEIEEKKSQLDALSRRLAEGQARVQEMCHILGRKKELVNRIEEDEKKGSVGLS